MEERLNNSVVVITGASSGIGRETARLFARQGASVVLAARRADVLQRLAEDLGPRTIAVPTDVTDESSVQRLADVALETFGRIDVWVNNAGVMAMGKFLEIPPEVFRQVIETNFFGYVFGARAALRQFKRQGRGVLINNASMQAKLSAPYATAYAASKHAVLGFVQALQDELALEDADRIRVSLVVPATIDTPLFQNTANYTGLKVVAMNPVYGPDRVASAILSLARHPRREVSVGTAVRPLSALASVARGAAQRTFSRVAEKKRFDLSVPAGPTPGNVLRPLDGKASATGGWRTQRARSGSQVVAIALPLLAIAGVSWYLLRRREI